MTIGRRPGFAGTGIVAAIASVVADLAAVVGEHVESLVEASKTMAGRKSCSFSVRMGC